MKLNADEIAWIGKRMETYHIIYQEIHDELTDHIITAIETARANGDQRAIETVFEDVVAAHFPGEKAMQKIQFKYVVAYNRKIRKTMWENMKYYFNLPVILATIILIISGFYLPRGIATAFVMMLLLIIAAAIPQFYVMRKLPKIKLGKRKMSLIRSFVTSRSSNLMLISTFWISVVGFWARQEHIDSLNPKNYHPVVFMVLLSFFIVYGLSSMRLCRQELKLEV